MKVTRRELSTLALAAAAPAQNTDDSKAARENLQRNAQAMAKVKVPVETEPAFQFKP